MNVLSVPIETQGMWVSLEMLAVILLAVIHLTVIVLVVAIPAVSFWPHRSQIVRMVILMVMVMPALNLNFAVDHGE